MNPDWQKTLYLINLKLNADYKTVLFTFFCNSLCILDSKLKLYFSLKIAEISILDIDEIKRIAFLNYCITRYYFILKLCFSDNMAYLFYENKYIICFTKYLMSKVILSFATMEKLQITQSNTNKRK